MLLFVHEGSVYQRELSDKLARRALSLYAALTGGAPEAGGRARAAGEEAPAPEPGRLPRTEKGKPYDPLGTAAFSVSHTGGLWACLAGDAKDGPVGLDIQARRPVRSAALAARFFTAEEQNYVKTHGDAGFFEIWCRKEAYLKYLGTGLGFGLASCATVDGGRLRSCLSNSPAALAASFAKRETGRPPAAKVFFTEPDLSHLGPAWDPVTCAICAEKKDEIWIRRIE